MIEHIKANAEMVVAQMAQVSNIDFGYDRESVEWLEGYIERQRESGRFEDEKNKSRLTSVFGSYLGECIVRVHGGTWQQNEYGWAVAFEQGNAAFPFAKVQKQIENGLEDGISSFFDNIPILFAHFEQAESVEIEKPEIEKPWWKFW